MKPKSTMASLRSHSTTVSLAAATTLALACAFSPAAAQQSTSLPATTRASDGAIDAMIQEAMLKHGTLDAVAAHLAKADQNDPTVLSGMARVSLERGDLAGALAALQALSARAPGEVATLSELAAVQDECGQTDAAAQSLRDAIAAAGDGPTRTALKLRLAILTLDAMSVADGVRLLDEVVSRDPGAAASAGVIAYLAGQFDAASRFLSDRGSSSPEALGLLAGNAALRAGRPGDALRSFEAAKATLAQPADQQYATERLIAAHRAAGTLSKLADEWLAEANLPAGRQLALATTLRELKRVPDLLAWWRREASRAGGESRVPSQRFTSEVLGAAQDAGLSDEVEAIARSLLAQEPAGETRWLKVMISAMLRHGKASEADALLAARVSRAANDPVQLELLGRLAKSSRCDAAAIAAARAMRSSGGGDAIRGMLLESSVLLRAGDVARCAAVLHEAADAAAGLPDALPDVATAFEAAGLEADAIGLLKASAQLRPDDAVLERLAALLVSQRRNAEAIPILHALRRGGSSAAVRAQAGQRLLDIAIADKKLDSLIAERRAALDAGTGTEADLAMLVDACVQQRKPEEAAEAIRRSELLDPTSRLNRLAVLYQRTGNLAKASETLRQLVQEDPASAVSTLERIASIELSLKQPREASAAVAEIARRVGDDSASFAELMGGIFDRLKRPAQAAPFYRRALAANPANADVWLLWATATSKGGQSQHAIGRLQVLANEAKGDSLFAIAVDGLLNLKAPPAALRAARRAATLRVAAAPQQTMLLQLIGDLSDDLQDADAAVRALDANVALDREARPQLLRELMENASGKRLIGEATACGRSMLALDDDFPPQLFLQLGEQLLIADRPSEASQAFARAIEVSPDEFEARWAADLYERFGYPAAAIDLLRPLVDRRPRDVSLRGNLARLYELAGQHASAFESHLSVARIADRQNLATSATTRANDPAALSSMVNLAPSIIGATANARTPHEQALLLDAMVALVRQRVDAAAAGAAPPVELDRLLVLARNASFALGRPDVADRIDQLATDRWPDRAAFQTASLGGRVEAGQFAAASRYAVAHPLAGPMPARLRLFEAPPTTLPASVTLDEATIWLPRMIARGDTREAEQLLDAVPVEMPRRRPETVRTLIAASVALNREDVVTRWTRAWMQSIHAASTSPADSPMMTPGTTRLTTRPTTGPRVDATQDLRLLVMSVWRALPQAVRAEVVNRAIELSNDASARPGAPTASAVALQLAAAEGVTFPGQLNAALSVARAWKPLGNNPIGGLPDVVALVRLLPAGDRPAFVRGALEKLPPEFRLVFLQLVASGSADRLGDDTAAAIVEAARALPTRQALIWSTWFNSGEDGTVLGALADATLRALADGPRNVDTAAFQAAAASAMARTNPARADRAALDALSTVVDVLPTVAATQPADVDPTVPPKGQAGPAPIRVVFRQDVTQVTIVRLAVDALSAEARERLMATLDARRSEVEGPGQRAWHLTLRSVLLDAKGRRGDALAALREATQVGADDAAIRQAYMSRLIADGRLADLVEAFARPSAAFPSEFRQPLVNALQQLFRFGEIPPDTKRIGASALQPYNALDFMTPRAAGDLDRLAAQLRALMERVRSDGDARLEIVGAAAGGLPGAGPAPAAADPLGNVAAWPGAIDELYATLGTIRAGTPTAEGIANILAIAARDPVAVASILGRLDVRAAAGAVTASDRAVLQALACVPGAKLSTPLIDELWIRVTTDPGDEPDYAGLAVCLAAQGDPRAADVERWASGRSRVRNPTQSSSAYRPPPGEPLPLGAIEANAVAWFEARADAGHADAAERDVGRLRETGRVSSQDVRWAILWARLAATRGDRAAFRARLDAAVEAIGRAQVLRPTSINLCDALPTRFADAGQRDAILEVAEAAANRAATRWPGDPNWTRALAGLGQRALEAGATGRANQLLDTAAALAERQGTGEHQLWVADLARLLGRPDVAWTIERRLLGQRCLPATRIEPLLQHIESLGDADVARRLAVEAAVYCREPNLRKRAGMP